MNYLPKLFFSFLFLAQCLQAQDTLVAPKSISLDEVVLSVSNWAQSQRKVPQKVLVLSKKSLSMRAPQTAADLLQQSGQVYVQKSQLGGGSPMIRGFSANRLLLAIDGVRMNNAIFRSGNLQNSLSIDPFALERVEVLYGAGSVIYGSDALGGVVHFYTQKPEFLSGENPQEWHADLHLRASSANDERTAHLRLSHSGAQWAWSAAFSQTDFGDLRMGRFGPADYLSPFQVQPDPRPSTSLGIRDVWTSNTPSDLQSPSGYQQWNATQKVHFRPNDRWLFGLDTFWSETGEFSRYDRLLQSNDDGSPRYAQWYYGPQIWGMAHAWSQYRPQSGWFDQMKLHATQQFFGESRNDRRFNDPVRYHSDEQVSMRTLNADFQKALGLTAQWHWGWEQIWNRVSSQALAIDLRDRSEIPDAPRYPDGAVWNATALYTQYQQQWATGWNATLGMRYSKVFSQASFDPRWDAFGFGKATWSADAFTGQLGLTYQSNAFQKWSANISRGFRAPNIDDYAKIFDPDAQFVVVPNPELKPEYATGIDLGIHQQIGGSADVRLTGFYTRMDQAMIRPAEGSGDQVIYQGEWRNFQRLENIDLAHYYGWEASVDWRLHPRWNAQAQYSVASGGERAEGGALSRGRHVPPAFGQMRLNYQHQDWNAGLWWDFQGEISAGDLPDSERAKPYIYALDPQGRPFSPSWSTLGARLEHQWSPHLTLGCALENITNRRYRTYSSGISAPGRNVLLRLDVRI